MLGLVYTEPNQKPTDNQKPVKILLDSGSSGCIVAKRFVRKLTCVKTGKQQWSTKAGSFQTKRKAIVSFRLPELHPDKTLSWEFHVDEQQLTHYDLLIGRDLLNEVGIDLLFSSKQICWEGATTSMRDPTTFRDQPVEQLVKQTLAQDQIEEDFIQRMTEQKYSPANLKEEAEKCSNLTKTEKDQLLQLLNKYKSLFDGSLGTWKTTPVELELREGAKPYHGRPYPVPMSQEKKLKDEIRRLEQYGVLRKINRSEWGMPSFTIVKKDGVTLRSIADLRELNKRLKRKPYPIPKIQELLLKLKKGTCKCRSLPSITPIISVGLRLVELPVDQ